MNKLLLHIIIFIFPILSSAQVLDGGAKLEKSLPGLTGIEKLSALNELHEEFKNRNRNKSKNYVNEAHELVESIDHDTSDINVSLQIGIAYINIGNCVLAEKYLNNSIERSQRIKNNQEILIDAYFTMGRLNMCKGGHIFGDIMFDNYEISKKNYDNLIKEEIQLYNEALNYFFKSLELLNIAYLTSEIKNLKTARAYYFIACCYMYKTEYEKTLQYYLEAYETYKKINLTKHAAIMLFRIGDFYRAEIQNYQKAIDYTLRAIEENEFSFDPDIFSTFKKIKIDELAELDIYYGNLGFSYYSQKDFNNALLYYLKIYKIQNIMNDTVAFDNVLNYIGRAYFELKNYDTAIKYYDTALIYSQKFNNKSAVAQTYYNLGLLYPEINEYKKSITFFEKSYQLREEIGRTQDMAYSLKRLGEVYEKTGNYIKAEKNYRESYKIAENIQDTELKNSILLKLSTLYEKTGDYHRSLDKYKLYKKTSDSLFEQKQNEQIIRQQVNFDLESKETE
ncbi:MAG: tetratricopeptide repeat protein, partial [Bacteroidales bacterium]|nr:tetratricopeptide repeat protein [Bacteroidales bacterium]